MYVSSETITNIMNFHGFIKLFLKKIVLRGVLTPRMDVGRFQETPKNPVSAHDTHSPKWGKR